MPDYINDQLSQGRKIKCSTSQAKNRLFIGNIPRSWGEKDLKKVVNEIGPGVTAVELVKVCIKLLCIPFPFLKTFLVFIYYGHA
jgi:hypothetical protein